MVYTKTCTQCGKEYSTEQRLKKLCPKCYSFNRKRDWQAQNAEIKKPAIKRREKKKPPVLTLERVCHIEAVYNALNKTYKHYHDIVRIIEDTSADRCVCCGDIIPEGRMVCPECERKAKEMKRW